MAMHCFKDIRLFVVSIGALFFFDVLAGVYFRSSFTTIERRFELSTTKLSFLSATYQIGNLAVVLFVSYYGSRSHRPRVIAFGSGLVSLGFFIACLPQFLGGRYEYVDATQSNSSLLLQKPMCNVEVINASEATCEDSQNTSDGNNLYAFILVGTLISGMGAAPLQPLGISYIDDFSATKKAPVYIGFVMTIALIGPAFGFLLGSALLRIWVDVGWVDTSEVTITPRDHNWVGAWWLGTLLCATLIAVTTIPVFFFPRKMRKDSKTGPNDELPHNGITTGTNDSEQKVTSPPKGILHSIKTLLSDSVYWMILLMWITGGLSVSGMVTFFPKYLEAQFGVSASVANMYYGAIGIPCLAVGTLLGSFIMKRLNPDKAGMAKIIITARIIATVVGFSFIFIGCPTMDIVGITYPYTDSFGEVYVSATSTCNSECNCLDGSYAPVCGADGMSYLSACHAGCVGTYSTVPGIIQNYTHCSCVNPVTQSQSNSEKTWSHPGLCESTNCSHYVMLVLGLVALVSFVGGIAATPSYVILLRSVPEKDKSLAIGISFMATRLLGWLPGPVIFGKVIDSTCKYWSRSCGEKGYCRVYDNDSFRTRYFGLQSVAEINACCFGIFMLFLVLKRQRSSPEHEDSPVKKSEKDIFLDEQNNSKMAAARLASSSSSNESLQLSRLKETLT